MSGFGQPPGGGGFGQPPGGGYGQPPGGGYPPPPGQPPGGGFGPPPGGGGFGPPPGSGGFGQPPGAPAPGGGGDALEKVKIPGLLLMIYGAIGILFALLNILYGVFLFIDTENVGNMIGPAGGGFLAIICNALVIFGGSKMRKLQGYGLAITACVLAILPCTGWCCIFGLVVGIWGIVVLMKDDVKTSFS
jgi:hypothetical protein